MGLAIIKAYLIMQSIPQWDISFVLIYQPDFIDDQTQIIWLRITVMGTILGLIGLRIIKRRRKRLGL